MFQCHLLTLLSLRLTAANEPVLFPSQSQSRYRLSPRDFSLPAYWTYKISFTLASVWGPNTGYTSNAKVFFNRPGKSQQFLLEHVHIYFGPVLCVFCASLLYMLCVC